MSDNKTTPPPAPAPIVLSDDETNAILALRARRASVQARQISDEQQAAERQRRKDERAAREATRAERRRQLNAHHANKTRDKCPMCGKPWDEKANLPTERIENPAPEQLQQVTGLAKPETFIVQYGDGSTRPFDARTVQDAITLARKANPEIRVAQAWLKEPEKVLGGPEPPAPPKTVGGVAEPPKPLGHDQIHEPPAPPLESGQTAPLKK